MSTEDKRFFQFLAGERQGEIVVYDHIEEEDGMVFVCFKDQSRCNEDLIIPINERNYNNQLMAEVENSTNIWKFDTKWIGRQEEKWSPPEESPDGVSHLVSPRIEGRKQVTPIPPRKSTGNFGQINKTIESAKPAPPTPQQQNANDPVWLMMDKAKKFDTDVEMAVTISLPTKSLYEVAKESFENGGEKVIEYIISNLDNQKLKDSLKIALKEAYGEVGEMIKELGEPIAIEEPIIVDATTPADIMKAAEKLKESE